MSDVKPTVTRKYAGQTVDQRVADRREALLEAAFSLVAEAGWATLRIETLCRRAGLNKRYFYESFENLDAVSSALTDTLAEATIAISLATLEPGMSPDEITRRVISAFVAHLTEDPRRARVLFGAIPAGEANAGHRLEAIHKIITTAASIGQGIHDVSDTPPVRVAAALLVGGSSQAILDWLDDRIGATQEQLIELLVALWQVVGQEAVRQTVEAAPAADAARPVR
jgi:AcrR family transcriptional regulator